jgi:pimeloyl-ACP methyl ester carboxylesterase
MTLTRTAPLLLLVILALGGFSLAQDARFQPADCSFAVPPGANVTCGYVMVPQDHQGDAQDTIRLYTAVYRSNSATPQPDPIIFLQGGPGGAIVNTLAMSYAPFIAPLTANRDLIVFDQRGTGLSEPALSCPEYTALSEAIYSGELSLEEIAEPSIEAIGACSARLQAEAGVNPAAYTSAQNAADVATIAAVLGYEQVNLYGGSYGTRLAQTVMRDYPALVRSAILDGVIPIELNLFEQQASKSQDALNRIFAACAADSACAEAYPDLEQVFADLMGNLAQDPLSVDLTLPGTGRDIDLTLTPEMFLSGLFFSFQVGDLAATIPQTIYQVRDGDVSGIRTALIIPFLIGDGINIGKFFAVNCHEEAYASSAEALDASADAYPLVGGLVRLAFGGSGQALLDTCAAWGAQPFDAREVEALRSDIPSLLMSGEFDSATPPLWAEQVAANLSRSTSIVLPAKGHVESLRGGCPVAIASAFLDDPQTQPDTSCLDDMPRIVFAGTGAASATTEIAFEPMNDPNAGVTGVIPQGWTRANAGVYVRGQSMTDLALLIAQAAPISPSEFIDLLTGQLGLKEVQEAEPREANGLRWTLYEADGQLAGLPIKADIALAEAGELTLLVALTSAPAERDDLRQTVFLPIVDALQAAE